MQGGYGKNNDFRPIPGFISELGRVIVTIVAGCPGTLNCGRPARVPGAATVVSFIEQGVVSAGRAVGGCSRSAAKDDACDEVSCGANILTRTDKSIK